MTVLEIVLTYFVVCMFFAMFQCEYEEFEGSLVWMVMTVVFIPALLVIFVVQKVLHFLFNIEIHYENLMCFIRYSCWNRLLYYLSNRFSTNDKITDFISYLIFLNARGMIKRKYYSKYTFLEIKKDILDRHDNNNKRMSGVVLDKFIKRVEAYYENRNLRKP